MGRFTADNQPSNRRGKGKKTTLPAKLTTKALEVLEEALNAGEQWAVVETLKRVMPPLKPVTPGDSLDGEMLRAKIKEITEFEERLAALEEQNAKSQ
ncbi:hypothetical protein [Vibrio agarivorans]|uniref:Uncharacterized protein n=1 Tax=Vibrio agarivorans TaxID=153622 RepID=A0ABT7Y0T5_9VIBR|nr:hypothetical protein [Vibrio agarivorans]MDN2481648.1 hypothetical protein [Vibrio agarivorans]